MLDLFCFDVVWIVSSFPRFCFCRCASVEDVLPDKKVTLSKSNRWVLLSLHIMLIDSSSMTLVQCILFVDAAWLILKSRGIKISYFLVSKMTVQQSRLLLFHTYIVKGWKTSSQYIFFKKKDCQLDVKCQLVFRHDLKLVSGLPPNSVSADVHRRFLLAATTNAPAVPYKLYSETHLAILPSYCVYLFC